MNTAQIVTVAVAGAVVVLAAFALLRALLRREPRPPSWRRYRVGVFLERDPKDDQPPV